jgi:PQQ-dependent dehydrogenase (methanol/ethanol family)
LARLACGLLVATGACRESHAGPAARDYAAADSSIRAAMADTTQWPSYGRDYSNRRYSRLNQVNAANVGTLQLAWKYENGIVSGYETNPIVTGGTMYITTPLNHVVALDAATGAKKWEYVHHYRTTADCCGPINRGVAVYDGRVFMGTVDARLVALDASTGAVDWTAVVGDNEKGFHITGAPLAIDGKVITGISCGEQGGRCYVSAYDAATGALDWRFYTIPSPADGGWWGAWSTTDGFGTPLPRDIAAEKRDSAKYADTWRQGGAPMWMTAAADPSMGLLFMALGNPGPDVDGRERPGDNLYSNCIVAVDVHTGKLKWYFQQTPHDLWDYDPASPVVLLDVKDASGKMVPAVAQAGKTAWVYVVDRATGKPIRRSDAFAPQEKMFTLPDENGVLVAPSTLGGSDWSPTAFDSTLGYLFVDGNYFPQLYKRNHEEFEPPAQYWGGSVTAPPSGQYGLYSAVDLNTGRIAWQVRLARPTISGSVATAGGVVFTGLSDSAFVAFDSRTGKELWRYRADAGVNAPPITYAIAGRQYVAVAAGGNLPLNSGRGDDLLVFALPPGGRP